MKRSVKIALFVVAGLVVIGAINKNGNSEAAPVSTSAPTSNSFSSTPLPAEEKKPVPPALPAERTYVWQYATDEDKMGETTKRAFVPSNEVLQFAFPYNGGSRAYLTARKSPKYGTDLIYHVTKGMIHTGYDGGTARMRLDDGKPFNVSYQAAADGSTETIFLSGAAGLIKKLQGAKKAVLEVEFYQEGSQQVSFDVEGLKWPIP